VPLVLISRSDVSHMRRLIPATTGEWAMSCMTGGRGASVARSALDRAGRQPSDYVALHSQIQQDRQQGEDNTRCLKLIQLD
jgi:hypothetical protein